jgi:hypothetical protein
MRLLSLTLGLGLAATSAADAPAPIQPADYLDLWTTLSDPAPNRPAEAIPFRELWSDPEKYQGRRVVIRGRLARRFSQPPVGNFPALDEDWIFDDQQNPFCAVSFREFSRGAVGDRVEFTGTFLRLARYRASDGDRLAPVLAGVRGPARMETPPPAPPAGATRWDRIMAAILALFVVVMLGLQHVRRPVRKHRTTGPAPSFVTDADPNGQLDTGADHA